MRTVASALSTLLAVVFTLSGCGGGSGDGLALPSAPTVEAPTALTAVGATDGVHLTWLVTDAQSVAVHRCAVPAGVVDGLCSTSPANGCGAPVALTQSASLVDVPPAVGQAYCYRVQACTDASGQSCGPLSAAVAAAQRAAPLPRYARAVIGEDGRSVYAGQATSLSAHADGAEGNVTYRWSQEGGPKVTLQGTDTNTLSFTAPAVTANTLLSFELRVTDNNGIGLPAKVAVNAVPADNVIVKATATRLVQAGHLVSLHAQGSAATLAYAWRQLSPASPVVALNGADTANPTFTAPNLPDGVLHFEVTATDTVTGRQATAKTGVQIQASAPAQPSGLPLTIIAPPQAPLLAPAQAPNAVPTLAPQLVPRQTLWLLATPTAVATGGTSVQLAATASGGSEPYQWTWTQTGGPAATLTDAGQAIPTVQLPVVSTSQTLTFQASLRDANGTVRTAQAIVQATVPPQPASGGVPTPMTALTPQLAIVGEPLNIATELLGVTIVQSSGPQLLITQQSAGGGATGTVITVTAPLIQDHSGTATIIFTGKDSQGRTRAYLASILIVRPPALAPPSQVPPLVPVPQPILAPRQDDPLVIVAGSSTFTSDEGKQGTLLEVVRGGKGTAAYQYSWTYLREAGGPDITLTGANSQRASFTAPPVDRPTDVTFRFTVTDGAQTATRDVKGRINDLAPTLVVGALSPLSVGSGQTVTLSQPEPTGGVPFRRTPPYDYSVQQTSGPATNPQAQGTGGSYRFTAPTLSAGTSDAALNFEFTATDRVGNVVKVVQAVTVTAPPASATPPLVAQISAPPLVYFPRNVNGQVQLPADLKLGGSASGGLPPYAWHWQVTTTATPAVQREAFVQNPTITLDPASGTTNYRAAVQLRVTDANNTTVTVDLDPPVKMGLPGDEAFQNGSTALLCGDLDSQQPCSELDLVLAISTQCPDSSPFAMNTVIIDAQGQRQEFRRCIDEAVAYQEWWLKTKPLAVCTADLPAGHAPAGTRCSYVCYGDDCNIDADPWNLAPGTVFGIDAQGRLVRRNSTTD